MWSRDKSPKPFITPDAAAIPKLMFGESPVKFVWVHGPTNKRGAGPPCDRQPMPYETALARSSLLRIFPLAVRGMWSTNTTVFGIL
ncbi:hypothetical protein GCM10023063_10140 [Arthrobacter methylotrophus]